MAYFANGIEGEYLDNQCAECIIPDDVFCPILVAQMQFNYDQCAARQGKLRKCLSMLVDDDGNCRMKPLIEKGMAE